MARKNKKKKNSAPTSGAIPTVPSLDSRPSKQAKSQETAPPANGGQAVRETIESLVIAFVLAFLFRTFQAEAFVIPTGSMAPTLMGMHKDVECSECGQRFKVNASTEGSEVSELRDRFGSRPSVPQMRYSSQCVAGRCPNCRHTMLLTPDLPSNIDQTGRDIEQQLTFNGDRILVNKYIYEFTEPERWDVIVFKYPGNAITNYIKRLVGLPNEQLRIWQGDLFVRPAGSEQPFAIAQKPASKLLAMRQLVHDTDRDAATLYQAGWPLRWQSRAAGGQAWREEAKVDGSRITQTYRIEVAGDAAADDGATGDGVAWLRYEHTPPSAIDWQEARVAPDQLKQRVAQGVVPELIADFNAYNTEIMRAQLAKWTRQGVVSIENNSLGLHWTGDLMIEANVQVQSEQGELLLDLVEAGQHFTCTIDLATGKATLAARQYETQERIPGFGPQAETSVRGPGSYELRLANVDDQLTLWVDGSVVEFDASTSYDVDAVFGGRDRIFPKSSGADRGDLAPAGIGARGAKLAVNRLQIYRDIYYIADSANRPIRRQYPNSVPVTDLPLVNSREVRTESGRADLWEVCRDQKYWSALEQRNVEEFQTNGSQFFVMGDNSAASLDARLWANGNGRGDGGKPGGAYLERSLLIGKAVCVYWPHSWYSLPFTGRRVPALPNFADMRLVR